MSPTSMSLFHFISLMRLRAIIREPLYLVLSDGGGKMLRDKFYLFENFFLKARLT